MMRKMSKKKKECSKKNRLLITVNVIGSPGPLKLLVNEDDTVSTVIDSSLKLYVGSARLPVLGSDFKNFILYTSNAGLDALCPSDAIGLSGGRNFVLSEKKTSEGMSETRPVTVTRQLDVRSWKSWLNGFNKSFKIKSH